jgi:hypothetical protein
VSSTASDPLDGISEKSTKSQILEAANKLADKVRGYERQRTSKLGEIEKRVRSKYKPGDLPNLHNVIVTSTEEEWKDVIEFLDEFDDVLPVALARIHEGGKLLLHGPDHEDDDE